MEKEIFYATGKRKTAVARIFIRKGEGNIVINKRDINDYFPREVLRNIVIQPLSMTETLGTLDIKVNVYGGGLSGQAGAIRHGIAKALININPDFRKILKPAGFLTRDSRVKERKKYGQRGARARFQFSKR